MTKNAVTADLEPEVPAEEIAAADEQPAEEAPVVEEKPAAEKPVEPEKEKFVPHAALHEERQRRKELQRETETLRQNQAVLHDRFQQLWQVVQPQPQFRDPDKDPDPVEALKHNQQLLAQQAHDAAVWRQQQEARARQADSERRLTGWAQAQAQEYAQENTDFPEAYNHIRMVRANELMALGLSGEELLHRLRGEELSVFYEAHQKGKNPAEIAFNMAKAAGWQPKKKEATPEQKIENLQKGTQASKSLGTGGAPSGNPTAEQIAAMSDDEFAELKAKLASKGKRLSDIVG